MVFVFKFMPWFLYMIQNPYKFYILFTPCITIFSAWYLATYTYKNILQIFPSPKFPLSFSVSGWTGRPDRSTGSCVQDVHARARLSVGRPVDRPKTSALCFLSVGRPVDRLYKTVFPSLCRSTGRSTRAQRLYASRADGRPGRSTAKPASCQRLFPLWWKSEICFYTVFVADFFWVLWIIFWSNKLKLNEF